MGDIARLSTTSTYFRTQIIHYILPRFTIQMVWNGTSPSQRLKYAALLAENVKKDATQTPLPDDPTDLNSKFDFEQHHTPKLSVDSK